jgi:tRNA dimethylallyltransferase
MNENEQTISGENQPFNLVTILGPTASGKTRLGVKVASELGTEIISADSRQVYKGMDLGTGKDLSSYFVDGKRVPCHLIDLIEPDADFSVYDFQTHFFQVFREMSGRGLLPLLVGGTGLYLDCALRNYRMNPVPENPLLRQELDKLDLAQLTERLLSLTPRLHNKTDIENEQRAKRAIEILEYEKQNGPLKRIDRPSIHSLTFGISVGRQELLKRIRRRLAERMNEGMLQEAQKLREAGVSWERLDYFGLEYRYLAKHLRGELEYRPMLDELAHRIGQFAKRQETWFRKMEREGVSIIWIGENDDEIILKFLRKERLL